MTKSDAFLNMPLSQGMLETLKNVGFLIPTPIQMKSIPELLQGRDLLGQAQTGTGKTAAFAVPVIESIEPANKSIQALVVCPTRELCLQVCEEIKRLSAHTSGISVTALYGGQAIEQQFKALKSLKPQIIVATPGRLFDHLRRKSIDLSTVGRIVLDEADEMLDMGFRDEIEQIFDLLPEANQRIFFSATMPKAIMELVHNYLRDPIIIKVESKNLTVAKIAQSFYRVRGKEKTEILCRVLDHRDPKLAVVFTNAKSTADEVVDEIKYRGFEAGVLHGDLSQSQRDRVMAKFKAGQIRVLVATDIAARGIDIDDIELVFNYHLPHDPEDYVHRIGRTGRAGREGRAISFVEPRDNSRLRRIMQFARADILEEEPPTLNEVKAAKMTSLFGKIKKALASEMIPQYRSFLAKQTMPSDDVAAGLIQMALEKFDEQAKDDEFGDTLRGKKYSGQSAERRRDFKEGRNGEFPRRFGSNFDNREKREPRRFENDSYGPPKKRFGQSSEGAAPSRSFSRGPNRFDDAGPKKFGDTGPKRFGDSGPKRFGDSGPKRFGDSGPKRFGDSGPKRFGDSEPKRFGDAGPKRFGDAGRRDFSEANRGERKPEFRESSFRAKEAGSEPRARAGFAKKAGDFPRSNARVDGPRSFGDREHRPDAGRSGSFDKKAKFKPGAKPSTGRPKPKR